jgi:Alr-MurF fusion protein
MNTFVYTPSDIASITRGKIIPAGAGNPMISDLLIDSRQLIRPEGTLFIALVSARNDGHRYIPELYEKGVRSFLVSPPGSPSAIEKEMKNLAGRFPDACFILVDNTLAALQALGAYHRKRFSIPVIGITGSNGKTIIKEWLYQLLSPDRKVIRSPKSFNSQIGVPLSVWKIREEHEVAIIEAGISQPGEMEKLETIVLPTIGIFTNIGHAHDENFSSPNQKAAEKLKLFAHSGILVSCRDYPEIEDSIRTSPNPGKTRFFTWSRKTAADLEITGINKGPDHTVISGDYRNSKYSIRIPFTDEASIENSIHCWSVMLCLGMDHATISGRMAHLAPIAMRLELKEAINRCSLINDSYNSDINSLGIAIDFLNQQKQHERKTVILSDILQSGRNKDDLYSEIAGILTNTGISRIIGIGEDISMQSGRFPMEKSFFRTTDEFLARFPLSEFRDETILLKGARIFEFEKISTVLQQKVHETVLEINMDSLVHNLNYYRSKLSPGTKTMVMVKAFSYGSGSYEIASLLQFHRVDYLAVAYADEGMELRKAGITIPVMVMNPEEESFDLLLRYDLEPEIYNFRILNLLEKSLAANAGEEKRMISVHIKLDTGMHRLGFERHDIGQLIRRISLIPEIRIRSVFSHLAASEDPAEDEFTRRQIRELEELSGRIADGVSYPFLRHILNSAGITRFPDAQMEMVRLGIGLYGIGFNEEEQKQLRNVSTLRSVISQVKQVKANDTIGYNRKGVARRDSVIAIVPIGYADGLNRRLGNGTGMLFIRGKPAPLIGNISMDTCMADITGIVAAGEDYQAMEGEEVIVFGEGYPVARLAADLGTIPYEVLTSISRRVKRIYYHE